MKFGEFTAVLRRKDRIVRVYVDDDSAYSEIDADGRLGSLLKNFEITEIAISNATICLKLKEEGA